MTDQEILERLGKLINEIAETPASAVTPEKHLVDDLDIDSMAMVEIAMAAQDEFGIEIPDDDLKKISTVQDVVDYIKQNQ